MVEVIALFKGRCWRLIICKRVSLLHDPLQGIYDPQIKTAFRKFVCNSRLPSTVTLVRLRSSDFRSSRRASSYNPTSVTPVPLIPSSVRLSIRSYIRLVEQGEERLIPGVEPGVFPIKFAIQAASTEDSQIQGVLMDAFAEGLGNHQQLQPSPPHHFGEGYRHFVSWSAALAATGITSKPVKPRQSR